MNTEKSSPDYDPLNQMSESTKRERDYIAPLDRRVNEAKVLMVAVNEIHKHDEHDDTYAYGIELKTKTPVRIRLSSQDEYANLKKSFLSPEEKIKHAELTKLNNGEEQAVDVSSAFKGKLQRQTLDKYLDDHNRVTTTDNRNPHQAKVFIFDRVQLEKNENVGGYQSFVAQHFNIASNRQSSQVISGLMTLKVNPIYDQSKSLNGFSATATVLEDANRLSSPDSLAAPNSEKYEHVARQNLIILLASVSNQSDTQTNKMPFARVAIRDKNNSSPDTPNLDSFSLPISREYISHEARQQIQKPDTMMNKVGTAYEQNRDVKEYLVAKSAHDTINDILSMQDHATQSFIKNYGTDVTDQDLSSNDDMRKDFEKVYNADKARLVIGALTGSTQIPLYTNQQNLSHRFPHLGRLYSNVKKGNYAVEVFNGQQFDIGAQYTETLVNKYLNDKAPLSAFRKLDDVVDIRAGKGVEKFTKFSQGGDSELRDGKAPRDNRINRYHLENAVAPEALDRVTRFASQMFVPSTITVQQRPMTPDQMIVVNTTTQDVTRSKAEARSVSLSDLTVEAVKAHKTRVYTPSNLAEFNYSSLKPAVEVMKEQRAEVQARLEKEQNITDELPKINKKPSAPTVLDEAELGNYNPSP